MALKTVSLAWNGLRWNGAASVARHVIGNNAVLTSIDLSNNDIDPRAAMQVSRVGIIMFSTLIHRRDSGHLESWTKILHCPTRSGARGPVLKLR